MLKGLKTYKTPFKKAYIETFGCQMNEHDSRRMSEILSKEGYLLHSDIKQANLIIINTCSVRHNPENKVYSLLGKLREAKEKNDKVIIGVAGCVAQQEGEKILKREKCVDMVFGPDNIFHLPEMIKAVLKGERVLKTKWLPKKDRIQNFIPDPEITTGRVDGGKAFISITKGCDNFCSFCVVPFTRGRLVSREMDNILIEAKNLIKKGARELMLLGQNVNSYRVRTTGFYELLKAVAELPNLKRLRFTSPHPNDWNHKLSDLLTAHPIICNQLHLPFQTGSNKILKAMNREHSIESYLENITYLKSINPSIELSTDLIVGFPGESKEDFQATLKILKKVKFTQVYAYKYSPRPNTKAIHLHDNIPSEVKGERLAKIITLQNKIYNAKLNSYLGRKEMVLIDSAHPKERNTMNGRTDGNLPVCIQDDKLKIGNMVTVNIVSRRKHSLVGKVQQVVL